MDGTSLPYVSDGSGEPAVEFFKRIENERGPLLTSEDHRSIVEGIRIDRHRRDD